MQGTEADISDHEGIREQGLDSAATQRMALPLDTLAASSFSERADLFI